MVVAGDVDVGGRWDDGVMGMWMVDGEELSTSRVMDINGLG